LASPARTSETRRWALAWEIQHAERELAARSAGQQPYGEQNLQPRFSHRAVPQAIECKRQKLMKGPQHAVAIGASRCEEKSSVNTENRSSEQERLPTGG